MKIYSANYLEKLFEQLLKDINSIKKNNDYEPYLILIPNKNIEYWLEQKIAEENNICMNFKFQFFEDGIWEVYKEIFSKDMYVRKIDPDFLSLIIFKIFKEEQDLKYFKNFIDFYKDYSGNIYDISLKLAELYFRYYFHNQELIDYFNDKNSKIEQELENNPKKEIIEEQKIIYKKIKEKLQDLAQKEDIQYQFFFDILEKLDSNKNTKIENKKNLFIFGYQFNNVFYFRLLEKLKNFINIYYYQILLYEPNHSKSILDKPQEISKNNLDLLEEILKEKSHYFPTANNSINSILKEIQIEFLKNGIENTFKQYKLKNNDNSICLIKAPSKKLEIKAVIQDIQEELLNKEDLKLNDIAILSPVLDDYFPLLKGYLEYLEIPYNIQDPNLEQISYFALAVETVIEILEELWNPKQKLYFEKEKILKIIQNPIFRNTFRIKEEEISIFQKLIDSLHIYFESEKEPYHSWIVGLKRLRAGKFTNEILKDTYEISPYQDLEFDEKIWEKIHRSIELFLYDLRELSRKRNNHSNIVQFYIDFDNFLLTYFDIFNYKDPYNIEKKAYNEFQSRLNYLKILKIFPEGNFLSFYFKLMFQKIKGKINEYLFQGITISSLQPLRPIPFKNIYILGLNQENFPGKDIEPYFDLQREFLNSQDKYYKNIINKREQNLFIFYEVFFSARNKITLSYVNYDLQSKKELYPSFVYKDFENLLSKNQCNSNIKEIPNTLKIRNNQIFNHPFEFYNSVLAIYRKNLQSLKIEAKFESEYLQTLLNTNDSSIKDYYINKKFKPNKIEFEIKKNNLQKKQIISLRDFIIFQEKPMEYYFKKNYLLSDTTFFEDTEEKFPLEMDKYTRNQILKEAIIEYLLKKNTDWLEITKKILEKYYREGSLQVGYKNFEESIKKEFQLKECDKNKNSKIDKKNKKNVKLFNLRQFDFYYKNYIYFNPFLDKNNFDLSKEVQLSSQTLEIPCYEYKNYVFEIGVYQDLLISLYTKKIYILRIEKTISSNFINLFWLIGLKEIFKDFEIRILLLEKNKISLKANPLPFDLNNNYTERKFKDFLDIIIQFNNNNYIKNIYDYLEILIKKEEDIEIREITLNYAEILNNIEDPLLKNFYEEVFLLDLQNKNGE